MKRFVKIALVFAVLLGAAGIWFFAFRKTPEPIPVVSETPKILHEVIGKSVKGRDIETYTFGKGENYLLFVGGIHGGYEWNTVLLAYQFIDYLQNATNIPEGLTVSVIPALNPDGIYEVTGKDGRFLASDLQTEGKIFGAGRLNANGVDLNRNFDCNWKPQSMWRDKIVSAGQKVFSEPEAVALRDFILKSSPNAVVFWHSQANTVYTSECENGILPKTNEIMNVYAEASGYMTATSFDSYEISGDAGDWLASIGIPAISVELKTHETIEWENNLAGIQSVFDYYTE